MVDSLDTPQTAEPLSADTAATSNPNSASSFLTTTTGKLVVGGVALLLILGAIAAILFLFVFNDAPQETELLVPTESTSSTSTASAETSPEVRPPDDFADTFAFRNIFQPTMKVTMTPPAGSSGSTSGDTSGTDTSDIDVPADTLFLVSTSTADGVPVATFIWNGVTYTLEEGESIPDTPWQVLSISGDTVVMLYGDARVTLTVGQGLSK
jgi:hypothetical protein